MLTQPQECEHSPAVGSQVCACAAVCCCARHHARPPATPRRLARCRSSQTPKRPCTKRRSERPCCGGRRRGSGAPSRCPKPAEVRGSPGQSSGAVGGIGALQPTGAHTGSRHGVHSMDFVATPREGQFPLAHPACLDRGIEAGGDESYFWDPLHPGHPVRVLIVKINVVLDCGDVRGWETPGNCKKGPRSAQLSRKGGGVQPTDAKCGARAGAPCARLC